MRLPQTTHYVIANSQAAAATSMAVDTVLNDGLDTIHRIPLTSWGEVHYRPVDIFSFVELWPLRDINNDRVRLTSIRSTLAIYKNNPQLQCLTSILRRADVSSDRRRKCDTPTIRPPAAHTISRIRYFWVTTSAMGLPWLFSQLHVGTADRLENSQPLLTREKSSSLQTSIRPSRAVRKAHLSTIQHQDGAVV
ncbi:hypothetical protein BDW67DRAFT_10195 [Aspergillus spinulosporus]